VEAHLSCEECVRPYPESTPKDPHDQVVMKKAYQLLVPLRHQGGVAAVVVVAVLPRHLEVAAAAEEAEEAVVQPQNYQ
jgi:hypothetical protein